MYRIDNATAGAVLPAPTAAGPNPNGYFEDKNPVGGVPGTIVPAEYMNMVQEELINVILDPQSGVVALNKASRNQLATAIKGLITTLGTAVPAGIVTAYAGSVAPTGYLLCAGQAVSRVTYAALFAAISTAFGSGDGSTTFNLPDLRGRFPLGLDGMNGSSANRVTSASTGGSGSNTRGATGGSEIHFLSISEMPAHQHLYADPATGGGGVDSVNGSGGGLANSGAVGGSTAHNNMPPWQAMNYIIKT